MRARIIDGNLLPGGGLPNGTTVEVTNDTNNDRWFMRVKDGKLAGDWPDFYLTEGQWMKANSQTIFEKPANFQPIYIRTIIDFFDD